MFREDLGAKVKHAAIKGGLGHKLVLSGGAPADCPAPADCFDDIANGDETDVDCGGSCRPCTDGRSCSVADECFSGVCTAATCQAPSCSDGVTNGDEIDTDCGGPDCDACPASGALGPETLLVIDQGLWQRDGEAAIDDARDVLAAAAGLISSSLLPQVSPQPVLGLTEAPVTPSLAGVLALREQPEELVYHRCNEPDPWISATGPSVIEYGSSNYSACCLFTTIQASCPVQDPVCISQMPQGADRNAAQCWSHNHYIERVATSSGTGVRRRVIVFHTTPESTSAAEIDASMLLATFRFFVAEHRAAIEATIGGEFDTALLFSDADLDGPTIDLSYVGGMCRPTSVAIHGSLASQSVAAGASNIAHSFGHLFKASHDSQGNACPSSGFIMASVASSGSPYTEFSNCSADDINAWLSGTGGGDYRQGDRCLENIPTRRPEQICGDGIKQGAEACDPGAWTNDPCCTNCQLATGCACDSADPCCSNGTLAADGTLCGAIGDADCDYPDLCDGVHSTCFDALALPGAACTIDVGGGGFLSATCWAGECVSLAQACTDAYGSEPCPGFNPCLGYCRNAPGSNICVGLPGGTDGFACGSGQVCQSGACVAASTTVDYVWNVSSWGACDGEVVTREVVCLDPAGTVVADAFCTGARPDSVLPCP